jgi:hypothetical protein
MSASEMREYLKRFNQRLGATRHGEAAAAAARDRAVNDALNRQRQTQQVYENYHLGRAEAAGMLRDRRAEQLESQRMADAFRAGRSDTLMMVLAPRYNPFAPTFDPASPSHYKRAAAAATLPGDLPPGDPRNFAVDVVGVDGPGPGTVILRGGGTVPNVGSDGGAGPESGASSGGGAEAPASD